MTSKRIAVMITLAASASFYRYVVLGDFESVFYISCDENYSACFKNTNACTENDPESECAYYYKAYVINQGHLDTECTSDDGDCLKTFCEKSNSCSEVTCDSNEAAYYNLTDNCVE